VKIIVNFKIIEIIEIVATPDPLFIWIDNVTNLSHLSFTFPPDLFDLTGTFFANLLDLSSTSYPEIFDIRYLLHFPLIILSYL